jgi:hypothetical protein
MRSITIAVNKRELSELYGITDDIVRNVPSAEDKIIIYRWMKDWASAYGKHDKFFIVFNQDDIALLYSVLSNTWWKYNSNRGERGRMRHNIRRFIMNDSIREPFDDGEWK